MGTDIHVQLEVRRPGHAIDNQWEVAAFFAHPFEERDYEVFCALGEMGRCRHEPVCEPPPWANRGLPEDSEAKRYNYRDDDGDAWIGEHSFSWVTASELRQAIARFKAAKGEAEPSRWIPWPQIAGFMESLEAVGYETRLVFGFDN